MKICKKFVFLCVTFAFTVKLSLFLLFFFFFLMTWCVITFLKRTKSYIFVWKTADKHHYYCTITTTTSSRSSTSIKVVVGVRVMVIVVYSFSLYCSCNFLLGDFQVQFQSHIAPESLSHLHLKLWQQPTGSCLQTSVRSMRWDVQISSPCETRWS